MADKETDKPLGLSDPYRELVHGVHDYAIFLLNGEGHIVSWNRGAERLKGYAAREIIGRHFSALYPPEAIERRWPQQELKMAQETGRFHDEGWRVRKDGSRFWANAVLDAIRAPDGTLLGFAEITRDITERKEAEQVVRFFVAH